MIGTWIAMLWTLKPLSRSPGAGAERDQVTVLEGAQPAQVKDRAEVHVERVVALPGEELDPGGEGHGTPPAASAS